MRETIGKVTGAIVLAAALAALGCGAIERESKRSEAYAEMQSGDLALEQQRYADAREAFDRAYEILKSIRDTAGAASALVGRGMAEAGLERHEEAVTDYDRALKLHSVEGAADDPWRGMVFGLIGESRSALAMWREAIAAHEESLRIYERAHGPEDPRILRALLNLAWAANVCADYEKARGHLDRAAAITGKPGFDDAMLAAAVMVARSELLLNLGRREEALDQARRGLETARARLAPDHPVVGTALNALGYGYLRNGDAKQALEQFEAARKIFEARSGPESMDAATVIDSEGEARRDLGQLAGALALHERALAIKRSIGDRDTDATAWIIDNIGRAKLGLGRNEEAIAEFERAAAIVGAIHGPDHPDVARELRHQARALCALGRADEARRAVEQALAILGRYFGADHPDVVETRAIVSGCAPGSGADGAGTV